MVVYHHNDIDGRSAAAVIGLYRAIHLSAPKALRPREANENVIYQALDYGDPIPVTLPGKTDMVYIVDFSLPLADMAALIARVGEQNIVWIDHHRSSLDLDYGTVLPGTRVDGEAGCVLTWKYLFGGKAVPEALQLIQDHDIWAHKLHKTWNFFMGMQTLDHEPFRTLWEDLLVPGAHPQVTIDSICERGVVAADYRRLLCEYLMSSFGFEAKLDGRPVFVSSSGLKGSETFGARAGLYDVVVTQIFCGDHWKISMYSPNRKVNVREICQRLGGGGHDSAAGCEQKSITPLFVRGENVVTIQKQ